MVVVGQPAHSSPYELAFGGLPAALHPRLRSYFSAIPATSHGYGEGIFTVAGVRRRWLRPLVAAFVPTDVMFPVWEPNVPFTVVNRPVVDTEGRAGVAATRRFGFRSGERAMLDMITAIGGGLVDVLGSRRRIEATLEASVVNGALQLDSTGVALRLGRVRIAVPRFAAPRVHLTERFDDATGRQHVSLAITMPLVGRVYEYAGSFSYEIRPGEGPS